MNNFPASIVLVASLGNFGGLGSSAELRVAIDSIQRGRDGEDEWLSAELILFTASETSSAPDDVGSGLRSVWLCSGICAESPSEGQMLEAFRILWVQWRSWAVYTLATAGLNTVNIPLVPPAVLVEAFVKSLEANREGR